MLRQISLPDPDNKVVSLDEAKRHLRISWDDEDDHVNLLIDAVQTLLDGELGLLGRALASQQWELTLDRFPIIGNYIRPHERGHFRRPMYGPEPIRIPLPPLISVDSVKYDEPTAGAETILTGFRVRGVGTVGGGYILPALTTAWPYTIIQPDSVRITFTAGYDGVVAGMPTAIKQAALLLISHFNENREAVVGVLERSITPTELPFGVLSLLAPHRIWR